MMVFLLIIVCSFSWLDSIDSSVWAQVTTSNVTYNVVL
eukprot:COSAG01_NODE_2306_length_7946_cov_4.903148_11_plen_38_part_00